MSKWYGIHDFIHHKENNKYLKCNYVVIFQYYLLHRTERRLNSSNVNFWTVCYVWCQNWWSCFYRRSLWCASSPSSTCAWTQRWGSSSLSDATARRRPTSPTYPTDGSTSAAESNPTRDPSTAPMTLIQTTPILTPPSTSTRRNCTCPLLWPGTDQKFSIGGNDSSYPLVNSNPLNSIATASIIVNQFNSHRIYQAGN